MAASAAAGLASIGMDSRAADLMAVKGGRVINTAIGRLFCLSVSASASAPALQSGDSATAAGDDDLAQSSQGSQIGQLCRGR